MTEMTTEVMAQMLEAYDWLYMWSPNPVLPN